MPNIMYISPWKFQLDLGGPDFIGTESGSQPPCPIGALQNMNPQEKSKKMDSTESGHPRLSLTAFFGEGRGGWGTNLEQSQIRQINDMYRMVPSSYWGDLVSQKMIKLNLAQPILYRFLCCICFLGGLNL